MSSVFDIVVTGDSCQSKCLEISEYMLSIGNNAIDDVDYDEPASRERSNSCLPTLFLDTSLKPFSRPQVVVCDTHRIFWQLIYHGGPWHVSTSTSLVGGEGTELSVVRFGWQNNS